MTITFSADGTETRITSRGYKSVEMITALDSGATLTVVSSRGRTLHEFYYSADLAPDKTGYDIHHTTSEVDYVLSGQTTFPGGSFEIDVLPI